MRTSDILIHPDTLLALERTVSSPSHALMLTGQRHLGKRLIARLLAAKLLKIPYASELPHQSLVLIEGDDTISVEDIRKYTAMFQLRSLTEADISRALVIIDADRMTTQAQNAFLKFLEEPPKDTVIIMTTSDLRRMMPTIRSRVQQIRIIPPSSVETTNYILENYSVKDEASIKNSIIRSGGAIGNVITHLQDEAEEISVSIDFVKTILKSTTLERLVAIEEDLKDKQVARNFVELLSTLSRYSLRHTSANPKQYELWRSINEAAHRAELSLKKNGNTKLVLTELMLSLR